MNKNEIIINELINSKLNNWNEISSQDLSEEFMDKYQDILDWKSVLVHKIFYRKTPRYTRLEIH